MLVQILRTQLSWGDIFLTHILNAKYKPYGRQPHSCAQAVLADGQNVIRPLVRRAASYL